MGTETDTMTPTLAAYARAVPLATFTAHGLGPLNTPKDSSPTRRLARFAASNTAAITAIDTAGATGRMLLALLAQHPDGIESPRLTYETRGADADEIADTVDRLRAAMLIDHDREGRLRVEPEVAQLWQSATVSFATTNAITTDALTQICRRVGVEPASNRKADKIDSLARFFADRPAAADLIGGLSIGARKLLDAIAEAGGLHPVSASQVDLPPFGLHAAEPPRYSHLRPTARDPRVALLAELSAAGLVGVSDYEHLVWIWSEAWPALDRPIYRVWPMVSPPAVVPRVERAARVPGVVALFDRAIRHWTTTPAPMLKNGEYRLGKQTLRSSAKTLATTEESLDLLSRLAMATRLLVPQEVGRSGRGRNARVDWAWMVDPEAEASWQQLSPIRKWMNLIAYCTRQDEAWGQQLLANRLLVLWELSALEPGTAFESSDDLARWVEHRHGSIGLAEAALEALVELRLLDVVDADDPVALTGIGRMALDDFEGLAGHDEGGATSVIVQADLSVVAPPDLSAELLARLQTVAALESDAGVLLYRLDEAAIVSAVQAGDTAEAIVEFLDDLSRVPIDDVVRRFVHDAAGEAAKLTIVDAPSVLLTTDPAELALAVRIKAAKLTPIGPTAALSALPAAKLQAVLARKRLAPRIVADTSSRPAAPRSSDRAHHLEQQAERYRRVASTNQNPTLQAYADELIEAAAKARDPGLRWQTHTSFAIGPGAFGADPGPNRGRAS